MAESRRHSDSERVLYRERPSLRARLVQPTVVKQGSLFLLCTDGGDIRADSDQGLYFHDMRYLSAESLELDGLAPVSLLADASDGYRALFELTNPNLLDKSGAVRVRKETLGIRRDKTLGDDYTQTLTIENYAPEPIDFTLRLDYCADFADMFVVRGMHPGRRGELRLPRWRGRTLAFAYDGADGHARSAVLHFSQAPDERHGRAVTYRLSLKGRAVAADGPLRTARPAGRPERIQAADPGTRGRG